MERRINMNIAIIGSGGREHAFAYKVRQSSLCEKLYCIPGNAGTASLAKNIDIEITDFEKIGDFCLKNDISLLIVGPELPLVKGIFDYFSNSEKYKNIKVFGPSAQGALMEGSKDFSKKFMQKHHIPTAQYLTITKDNLTEGIAFIQQQTPPIVLKADGLASGKGVLICDTHHEAIQELQLLLSGKFGESSSKVVIEQFLKGIEYSVFVITDGKQYKILPEAKDYKRIGEGDTGLNTGGMGAVSPVPFVDSLLMEKTIEQVIKPTVKGIEAENINYKGFIYFGLINVGGNPMVIEYNCRLGDPETEVVLPRLENDIVALILSCFDDTLGENTINISSKYCVTTVLASRGYPENAEKGKIISFPETDNDSFIFHSGTAFQNNSVVSNGGRVLAVSVLGNTLHAAMEASQKLAAAIDFDGKYFRKDIGKDVLV